MIDAPLLPGHVVTQIGACFDENQVYSIYTEWGIWTSETVKVDGEDDQITWSLDPKSVVKSSDKLHGEQPTDTGECLQASLP